MKAKPLITINTRLLHPDTAEEGKVTTINNDSIKIEFENGILTLKLSVVNQLLDLGKLLKEKVVQNV